MQHFFTSLIYTILGFGMVGLFLLAMLDSTLLFYLPFALDTILILLVSHHRERVPYYIIVTIGGALVGALLTYWMVKTMSEEVLEKHVSQEKFNRIKQKVMEKGFWGLAIAALLPPPFPFTPFLVV